MTSGTAVTVVSCRRCGRSADLLLTEGRFWCAWCEAWAELGAERVDGSAVLRHGEEPRPVPVRPTPTPRQPLRIPRGWTVTYNEFLELDPEPDWIQGMDLFQATSTEHDRVVDLSWYFGDADEGSFRLVVWSSDPEAGLLFVHTTRDRVDAVRELEEVLRSISSGRP
jgi:hypothetical protein